MLKKFKRHIIQYMIRNRDRTPGLSYSTSHYQYKKKSYNIFLYPNTSTKSVYYSLKDYTDDGFFADEYPTGSYQLHQPPIAVDKFHSWNELFDSEFLRIIKIYPGSIASDGWIKGRVEEYTGYYEYIVGEWFFKRTLWNRWWCSLYLSVMKHFYKNPKKDSSDLFKLRSGILASLQRDGIHKFSKLDFMKILFPMQMKYPMPDTYNRHHSYIDVLTKSMLKNGELSRSGHEYEIDGLPTIMAIDDRENRRTLSTNRLAKVVAIAAFLGILATSHAFDSVGNYIDAQIVKAPGFIKRIISKVA